MFSSYKVVIKGGGDLASAVAHRLHRSGFPVIITELSNPKMVRRTVAFGNVVYEKICEIEGITSKLVNTINEIHLCLSQGKIPVIIDPECRILAKLRPTVLIDGTLSKKNLGTFLGDAPIVIGLGPGFTALKDVDAVIETKRGHYLGKVILKGTSMPDTGVPGDIMGYTHERVLRAPETGIVKNSVEIGDMVSENEIVSYVGKMPIRSKIAGIVRGIIHDGIEVKKGEKLGDVDPRGVKDYCYSISDKGRAIAGGVLEAILYFIKNK